MHVSVIVPTWNERENIRPLLEGIAAALAGTEYEIVVVDDNSPDGTGQEVEAYMQAGHQNVNLLRRPEKQGLSGAVLEGATMAQGDYLVMMDADLSHDSQAIPALLRRLDEGHDVVVGSRYVGDVPSIQGWPLQRRLASRLSIMVARLVLRLPVQDLTSGFVAFRRTFLTSLPTRFSARGFKLLLEVLAVWRDLRVTEYPITFTDRARGFSKFGLREMAEFGRLCLRLWWYRLQHRQRG